MMAMDFQAPVQRRFRWLRFGLLTLVGMAALSLVAALLVAERYRDGLAETERGIAELRAELSASVLGEIDLEQLAIQAGIVRDVVAHIGAPLPDVLAAVTDAVPANVRLELLEYDARGGTGTIRAVSPDPHALADFVRTLESGASVRRAVVARQETLPGPEAGYRHDIHLVAEP